MPGYYYFCGEDTPYVPGWHYFGSRNWHAGDGTPWPEFGEREDVKQTWRNGFFPAPRPDPIVIGNLELEDCPPPAALILGVDVRCWKSISPPLLDELAGGDLADGALGDAQGDVDAMAGGDRADGALGDLAGGADLLAGGDRADGSIGDLAGGADGMAGGDRADGKLVDLAGGVDHLAGGDKADGSAADVVAFHDSMAGGSKADGAAIEDLVVATEYVLANDFSNSNNPSSAKDLTGFAFPVAAAETWHARFMLLTSNPANGFTFTFSGPTTPTLLLITYKGNTTAVSADTVGSMSTFGGNSGVLSTGSIGVVYIDLSLTTDATHSGTVQLRITNQVNGQTVTIAKGSWMKFVKATAV